MLLTDIFVGGILLAKSGINRLAIIYGYSRIRLKPAYGR